MDWSTGVVLGLLVLALAVAVHQAWTGQWTATRTRGMVVFLGGAGVGLLVDDLLAPDSVLQPFVESVGALSGSPDSASGVSGTEWGGFRRGLLHSHRADRRDGSAVGGAARSSGGAVRFR